MIERLPPAGSETLGCLGLSPSTMHEVMDLECEGCSGEATHFGYSEDHPIAGKNGYQIMRGVKAKDIPLPLRHGMSITDTGHVALRIFDGD